jgi:biopolymer transport protein ExbB/TolQ
LLFFIWSLIMGGSFYGQFLSRTRNNREIKKLLETKPLSFFSSDDCTETQQKKNPFARTICQMMTKKESEPELHRLLGDYEILPDKDLGRSRLLTRLGPMLGLMGTLIPMGPALVGLASGDVASMASNMQVAFATTVIGIFTGAVGYITLQVKQRWYADDMNTLEYVVESLTENLKTR